MRLGAHQPPQLTYAKTRNLHLRLFPTQIGTENFTRKNRNCPVTYNSYDVVTSRTTRHFLTRCDDSAQIQRVQLTCYYSKTCSIQNSRGGCAFSDKIICGGKLKFQRD